jgi:hypothetical protein
MKSYWLLFFGLLFTKSFAQNVTSPEEQDEIKQAIANEAKFFYARNGEKWANCYRQTPQTYWACIEKDGTLQKEGWDNIGPFVLGYIKDNPKPVKCTFKRDNYNFRKVNPTYIWVTFDQIRTTAGKKEASKETRILELIKSEWKIINMTGFYVPIEKSTTNEAVASVKEKDKKDISGKDKKNISEKDKKIIAEKTKSESSENEPKTKPRKKIEQ